MEKLCLFVILAIITTEGLGMSYRNRRQTEDVEEEEEEEKEEEKEEEGLEVRYRWISWRPKFNPFPTPRPNPNQDQTTTIPSKNPTVFIVTQELRECRQRCPTTSEYNPLCGTNMQTYDNPSKLFCDQACGVTVSKLRSSRCN